MRTEFTRPEEILEELADKTAVQIERLAPVAFDRAFREMTRYHRFLLGIGASRTPDGAVFNFAEVPGYALQAPHKEWIRQYGRLFERATDRLADDSLFMRSLAHAPSRLLPRGGDPELSPNVVRTILDLGPILVSRLEAWVTKRTTLETPKGQSAKPRLALAGSDAKAYEDVLPHIVGAWEGLLNHPPSMYDWPEGAERDEAERWATYHSSWAFLWQHLTNTAYCLAIAVWNEDEIGSALLRDALVRWPQALEHRMSDQADLRHRRLLFPDLLTLNWAEASAAAAPLGYDYMPAPNPDQLFVSVVRSAQNDVVLLTATVLLSWSINCKQATDIGARTARALLSREVSDHDDLRRDRREVGFRSQFLDVLRFELVGGRYRDSSYAVELDRLVSSLDNMTERRVVPGRVFKPSTMHGRGDLLLPQLAMLLAHTPEQGDDGVHERIAALAREEDLLPEGDGSLRDIARYLEQLQSTLENPLPELTRWISILAEDHDAEQCNERLSGIVSAAITVINEERHKRLQDRTPDPAKLERIRSAIETALLNEVSEASFFRCVEVGAEGEDQAADRREMTFNGIHKAQLLEPPMEPTETGFEARLVSRSRQMAGNLAWTAFCGRHRSDVIVSTNIEDEAFWSEIAPLIEQVGPDPVLVVSRKAEGSALRRFLFARPSDRPRLKIEQRARDEKKRFYIATIEGVDVFGADFPPCMAWLFSAQSLRAVRYVQTGPSGRYADLAFEIGEDMKGTLRVGVRQTLEWSDSPIFELQLPGSGEAHKE